MSLQNPQRYDGPAGLYRGVGMTLLRDVPSHGVYFGVYDWTRDMLEPGCRAGGHQSHASALIAGAFVCNLELSSCACVSFPALDAHPETIADMALFPASNLALTPRRTT